jgi:hypothetical protein
MPLPQGLVLNQQTGEVTGTPLAVETANFTLTVRDALGTTRQIPSTIVVNTYTAMSFSGSLALSGINVAYSSGLTLAGGAGPYLWSISVGTLPVGLGINSTTGLITGTPTVGGTSNFTIRVQDSLGLFITSARTIFVALAPIIAGTAPNGTLNIPYTFTYTTTLGNPGYTYSLFSGSLPPGLTLSAAGVLSGTPSSAGGFTFVVRSTDLAGRTSNSASQTPTIAATVSLTGTYPRGTVSTAYNSSLTQVGGIAPFTYSVFSGTLPAGLTLNTSTSALTGTPTTPQTAVFVIRSVDSLGNIANSSSQSITIAAALTYTGTLSSFLILNSPYSSSLTAANGWTPYSYTISVGTLPTGLTLNPSTGVVSGTPTGSGTSNFTMRVQDADGNFATSAQSLTVQSALAFTSNYAGFSTTGLTYDSTPGITGGVAPYTFTLQSGAFPPGLSISTASTGRVQGTVGAAGTYNFTVRCTDSASSSVDQAGSIVVSAAPVFASVIGTRGTLTVAYTYTASVTGGRLPLAFTIFSGSLPGGLALNGSTGNITGTPSGTGTFPFTLRATDANGAITDQAATVVVAAYPTLTGTYPRGAVGTAYSASLTGALGHTPYSFSSTGTLPNGLTLSSAGGGLLAQLNGTPTVVSTFTPTIRLTDAAGNIVNSAQSIQIAAAVTFGSQTLNAITQGISFTQTITATGGYSPYVHSISAGALPTGLTLSNTANGTISGTASGSGAFSFTLRAVDADGNVGTKSFAGSIIVPVTVVANDHTISSSTPYLPDFDLAFAYYYVNANGTLGYGTFSGSGNYSGEGVTVGSASAVEYQVTATGSALSSGTLNTWRNMASFPDSYGVSDPRFGGAKAATLTVSFRRASDGANLDGCIINLDAETL